MRHPNLFFVGHPRSGSGLLDSYLKGHPDIFMARKELHYFGSDLRYHVPPRTVENYLAHFEKAGGQRWVGEASTWTLSSETAAREIRDFEPDARILMQLRDPVGWLHSLHSHLVFTGDEDIAGFAEALAAEPDRAAGHRLPSYSLPGNALQYRSLVHYADQVGRFFDVFGRRRVHVVILDDMKVDSAAEYRKVLTFLGLPTEFPGMDEVLAASRRSRNTNRTVRSERLRHFINHPSRRRILEGVDTAPVLGVGMAIRAMRRLNIRYCDRAPLEGALRAALTAEFTPQVEKLEALLGRDLSAWKSARS